VSSGSEGAAFADPGSYRGRYQPQVTNQQGQFSGPDAFRAQYTPNRTGSVSEGAEQTSSEPASYRGSHTHHGDPTTDSFSNPATFRGQHKSTGHLNGITFDSPAALRHGYRRTVAPPATTNPPEMPRPVQAQVPGPTERPTGSPSGEPTDDTVIIHGG
jgi:hypothetical protein